MAMRKISTAEIGAHNTKDNAWIVVNDLVYDVTTFEHPGGDAIIYENAGRDASKTYNKVHPPKLIGTELSPLGELDASTVTMDWIGQADASESASSRPADPSAKPPLSSIISIHDLERVSRASVSDKDWAYISTGSMDNTTRALNLSILSRIMLRPRIFNSTETINTSAKLFGMDLSSPFFICPTGTAKMAGPDGELALVRAAVSRGIGYAVSTPSSVAHADVLAEVPEGRKIWFQLYVNRDHSKSEELLRAVVGTEKVGAIFVTGDLPVISKRDDVERIATDSARKIGAFMDCAFRWKDLAWVRSVVGEDMPIVAKGLQRADDVRMAMEAGCQGVLLSNHGGRAVDGAPPSILTLLECHKVCPEVFERMEVMVDGGFRRGSDVVKAICLGASAVGMGRPFLYGVHYGKEGVEHAIDIIRDEIQTTMQLSGIEDLMRDANPDYVNTSEIDHLVYGAHHPYAKKATKNATTLGKVATKVAAVLSKL